MRTVNSADNTLLLFTPELPCWDAETVGLAGDDPKSLAELEAAGNVARLGGGYVLTRKGIQTRKIVSRENYVPSMKIDTLVTDEHEASRSLELNRMVQLLDRAFMTEWGIKEFKINETFPVVPCLEDDEYFAFEGERVKAIWPENEYVKSFMAEFPDNGYEARKLPAPGPEALSQWAERHHAPRGNLTVEFVLRHHHDFAHYRQLPTPEGDIFGFVNAGIIFARKFRGKPEELLPFIGRIRVFFTMQRRIYIPGWFDMDSEEQEPGKMVTFITDTDDELRELTRTLRRWGLSLIEPACPIYIMGTSIEHLRNQETKSMIYDWFAEETVKILRPDFQDEE